MSDEDGIRIPVDVLSPYDSVFRAVAEYIREEEGLDTHEYVTEAEFHVATEEKVTVTSYTTEPSMSHPDVEAGDEGAPEEVSDP